MPRDESKHDDEASDAPPQKIRDPLVFRLIEWGTSASFEANLSDWMKRRCDDYVEMPPKGEEQPLSWGNGFGEYNEWLEDQLEEFCEENDASAKEVAAAMEETMSTNDDFFPAFMAITEYAAFVTQMHNLAVMAESRDNAYRAADDKNEGKDGVMNISGIWEADPDSYDPEGAERMLEHGKCPWMFRKILKRSARLIKDVQLTQTVTDFTFIFTLHLFGTSIQTHPYGVMRDDFNLWGKPFKIKLATPDEHGVKYQQFGHPGLPDDTIDTSHFWITDGGDRLMWESKMYRSDIDKEVTNLQQFIRKGGGLSSRK